MDEPGERQERLVRRDVRGRLLAADVLLAGLQGQDIGAPAFDVGRLTDDPAGHAPHIVGACRQEAVMGAAVRLVVARRLSFADGERAAVRTRSLEDAERDRVDVRDRQGTGVVRGGGEVGCRLQAAEEIRLLEDDARRVARGGGQLVRIGHPVTVRDLDHLEAEAGGIRLHDLSNLRVQRLGEDDARAAGDVLGDEAGVCGDRRAVVAGRVRDVHAGQLADRGLVLEDRLQHALAHLRLVRRVRGQELPAREDGVDDRGHVVVVDPSSEEGELAARVDVLGGELLEVGDDLLLRESRLEVELAIEAHALRDVAKELVDRLDADRREHLLAVSLCEREEAHCSSTKLL